MSTVAELPNAAESTATAEAGLLDTILCQTRAQDDQERDRNKSYIEQFVRNAVQPGQVVSKDVEANIKFWIAELDKKLSAQLNEIMHNEEFQKLESTWRGLRYLVMNSETGDSLKIRVLNVKKQ